MDAVTLPTEPVSRIVFWQPIASPHQEAFLEALAVRFRGEVILGVERPTAPERARQGWTTPSHDRVEVRDLSVPGTREALAADAGPDTLHVFSGFFSHPLVWDGFRRLARSRARLAIMSEAPEQPWATGWLKRCRGRWLASRWASRFEFVLAIGTVGRSFFLRIGFPSAKVLPFGYFLDVPPLVAAAPRAVADATVRLVAAGQLIPRKGIDLLVRACRALPAAGWRLDLLGDGPDRPLLERLVRRCGLSGRIRFHGTVPNADVRRALAAADRAVLPSRFDGWGMIVNEALAVGTPVICTDACGAAALVSSDLLGSVVPPDRPSVLAAALASAVAAGPVPWERRLEINRAVAETGSAAFAAALVEGLLADAPAASPLPVEAAG